jgi:hypothetical protein
VSVIGATVTSGLAGVYQEKLLKDGQQPFLLVRSAQLGKPFKFVLAQKQSKIFNNNLWIHENSKFYFRSVYDIICLAGYADKRRS